jgi:SNF2 family DNA or RNA helicase
VAAHIDVVLPFLDSNVASILVKRMGVLNDSGAAASAELEELNGTLSSTATLSSVAAEIASRGKPATPAAALEAIQQREELERRVDIASLPVMQYPAPLLPQPEGIDGSMRPYQLEGFSWMSHCYRHGVNCILADEMGLGKTLQTIAYLTHVTHGNLSNKSSAENDGEEDDDDDGEEEEADSPQQVQDNENTARVKGDGGPHLVVVPLSVLTSWVLELRKFAPGLRVVRLHSGDEKERDRLRKDVS